MALVVKNLPDHARDARDTGLIPVCGRCPGAGNGNPLQCSCLENSMDRGSRGAAVHRVTKNQIRLSTRERTHAKSQQPRAWFDCLGSGLGESNKRNLGTIINFGHSVIGWILDGIMWLLLIFLRDMWFRGKVSGCLQLIFKNVSKKTPKKLSRWRDR